MSSLGMYVVLAALSPLIAATVPMAISKTRKELPPWVPLLLLGISSGMLFAVATLDLLPEGIEMAASQARREWNPTFMAAYKEHEHEEDDDHDHDPEELYVKIATFGVFCGYLVMMIIEQLMDHFGAGHSHQNTEESNHSKHSHSHSHGNNNNNNQILSSSFSLAALVGLGVHAFVDGVMIGGAFIASDSVGARVGIAIVLHKFPDGFVLSSILQTMSIPTPPNRQGRFFFEHIGFFVLSGICLMTPIGALLSYVALDGIPATGLGFVLCLGSGTFFFITCSGIIPELLHQEKRKLTVGSFAAGYFLFLISDTMFHAH